MFLYEASSGEQIFIKHSGRVGTSIEKNQRVIIEAGTGSSKTETIGAMYVVWKMFLEKNKSILLLAKSRDQATSNILSRIKRYIENSELLVNMLMP